MSGETSERSRTGHADENQAGRLRRGDGIELDDRGEDGRSAGRRVEAGGANIGVVHAIAGRTARRGIEQRVALIRIVAVGMGEEHGERPAGVDVGRIEGDEDSPRVGVGAAAAGRPRERRDRERSGANERRRSQEIARIGAGRQCGSHARSGANAVVGPCRGLQGIAVGNGGVQPISNSRDLHPNQASELIGIPDELRSAGVALNAD